MKTIACCCAAISVSIAIGQMSSVPATRPATDKDIARLVAGLANRSYQKREEAARRIAEVGPAAIPYLRREIDNPRQEIALAARELTEELQDVLFCGVSVRLEVDPPQVRWDQPIRLRVVTENGSPFEAKLPWDAAAATSQPASLAEGVGLMLAVADFLEVTSATDQPIDLRIESIENDRAVLATVNGLAADGPVSMLGSGQRCIVDLPEFNRGWARYPLLAKGRYRMHFTYQPEWSRTEWIEAGVGKVVSNVVEIEVLEAAPPAIRKATQPVRLLVARDAEEFVARLQSTWDRPVCVNLNFGPEDAGFAQLGWRISQGDDQKPRAKVPAVPTTAPTLPDPSRIRRLKPGEEVKLARIAVASLQAAADKELAGAPADGAQVSVVYTNHATREDIRRMGEKAKEPTGAALRRWAEENPYPVLTGAPASRAVPLAATSSQPAARRQ